MSSPSALDFQIESPRILLADDEKAITDYLVPLLERVGLSVESVQDDE